jgi:hypothetical protein
MRDRRRWYRPGPCQRQIRCVGTVRRAAHGLSPLVDQRTGRLVDPQVGGAVQAHADRDPAHPLRAHRDHLAPVTRVGVDHAAVFAASANRPSSSSAVCRAR